MRRPRPAVRTTLQVFVPRACDQLVRKLGHLTAQDALAVTLNVLLSDGFEAVDSILQEGIDDLDCGRGPALCLLPSAGVGVVLRKVKHAGREVVSGPGTYLLPVSVWQGDTFCVRCRELADSFCSA